MLLLSLAVGCERPIGQWAALGRGSTAQHTQVRLPARHYCVQYYMVFVCMRNACSEYVPQPTYLPPTTGRYADKQMHVQPAMCTRVSIIGPALLQSTAAQQARQLIDAVWPTG